MPKMTKTQIKRLYSDIKRKAARLWVISDEKEFMSTADYITIEKIIRKYQKRIRDR